MWFSRFGRSFTTRKKNDTLEVYKFVQIEKDKWKFSEFEIIKYATRNGKIIREGSYKIENDTLMVVTDFYSYSGSYRMTDKYITDKYGLKQISDEMKSIDTENLSDKYIKPAKMIVPPPTRK